MAVYLIIQNNKHDIDEKNDNHSGDVQKQPDNALFLHRKTSAGARPMPTNWLVPGDESFSSAAAGPILRARRRSHMPLPHFLLLIVAVILAAAITLWASLAAGVPLITLLLVALTGAALLHFSTRNWHDHDR